MKQRAAVVSLANTKKVGSESGENVFVIRMSTPHPQGVCAINYDASKRSMVLFFAPGHVGVSRENVLQWRTITWQSPGRGSLKWRIDLGARRAVATLNQRVVRPGYTLRCVHVRIDVTPADAATAQWVRKDSNGVFTCTLWDTDPELLLGFSID